MKRIDHLVNHLVDQGAEVYPCGEPGYDDKVILFDWHKAKDGWERALERQGFVIGWRDEWVTINNTAYRCVADSWDWSPQWVWFCDEPELKATIRQDFGYAKDYIEQVLLDTPTSADTIGLDLYLMQLGFTKDEKVFESGIREGCNDDPTKIYNDLKHKYSVVFQAVRRGDPFVIPFVVWKRPHEYENLEDGVVTDCCFVYTSDTPEQVTAVMLGDWWNDIFLTSYAEYGQHGGFSPEIFNDIANGVPVYGTSKEVFWRTVDPTNVVALTPIVRAMHKQGYNVSIKPCPTASMERPFGRTRTHGVPH